MQRKLQSPDSKTPHKYPLKKPNGGRGSQAIASFMSNYLSLACLMAEICAFVHTDGQGSTDSAYDSRQFYTYIHTLRETLRHVPLVHHI